MDILSALVCVHSLGYCHLDVKSDNIFISTKDDRDPFIYISPSDINMKGSYSQELLFASQHETSVSGYKCKENSMHSYAKNDNSQYKSTKWEFKLGDFGLVCDADRWSDHIEL